MACLLCTTMPACRAPLLSLSACRSHWLPLLSRHGEFASRNSNPGPHCLQLQSPAAACHRHSGTLVHTSRAQRARGSSGRSRRWAADSTLGKLDVGPCTRPAFGKTLRPGAELAWSAGHTLTAFTSHRLCFYTPASCFLPQAAEQLKLLNSEGGPRHPSSPCPTFMHVVNQALHQAPTNPQIRASLNKPASQRMPI